MELLNMRAIPQNVGQMESLENTDRWWIRGFVFGPHQGLLVLNILT